MESSFPPKHQNKQLSIEELGQKKDFIHAWLCLCSLVLLFKLKMWISMYTSANTKIIKLLMWHMQFVNKQKKQNKSKQKKKSRLVLQQ